MNQNLKIIIVSLIALFVFSCKNKPENDKVKAPTPTEIKQSKETPSNIFSVKLNDGKKWIANKETTDGIKKMQLIMNSFSDKESINEYKILKQKLEVEFTNIFALCTMKGESHNQLHNYLKPMISFFDGLESNELITCKTNFNNLEVHLKEYSNFFE